jgi:Subtilase family
MSIRESIRFLLVAALAFSVAGFAWIWLAPVATVSFFGNETPDETTPPLALRPAAAAPEEPLSTTASLAELADLLHRRFNRARVRLDEGILTFRDDAALQAFLARAGAAGVEVLGRLDRFHAIRARIKDYDAFARELTSSASAYAAIASNAILPTPTPPIEARNARISQPVGNRLLATLGVNTDNSDWGKGVIIAVVDGGVVGDTSFGSRLSQLDIGYGLVGGGTDGSHATSVAALAAGGAADVPGVAPSASLLSIRVTGADGSGDVFSVAQGIYAAVDAGAQIINVSLGGYATSSVLADAVDYALAANVAVVAAAGNDQAAQLAWPAAYPGVVSVGAVDARGQQTLFSNSGGSLQLTAPGYAITTVGAGGSRVSFSGTSASAPVVSGAIAALLSTTPGLNALQAADLLATYSTDSGPVGPDPDYGRGTVNLSSALNRTATAAKP